MAIESNLFNMLFQGLATDNSVNAVPQRNKLMDQSTLRSRQLQDQIRQQTIQQNQQAMRRSGQNKVETVETNEGMFELTRDPSGKVINAQPIRVGQQVQGVGNSQTPTGGVLRPDQMNRRILDAPQQKSPFERLPESIRADVVNYLPPELQANPMQASQQDIVKAAAQRAQAARQPSLQERKFQYEQEQDRRSQNSPVSVAQKKVDQEFGKEYVDWKARGGYADVEKNLQQLRNVKNSLESVIKTGEGNLTGGAVGATPDRLLSYTNPDAIDAKEQVQEVVQRNLRLILGAQFTEKEGERLISRAYNDALSEEKNLERVNRLISQIEQAAKAKESAARYYEQNGTLTGWEGELYTPQDLEEAAGPQKGEVEDGYRFKGGDPADRNNWVKV